MDLLDPSLLNYLLGAAGLLASGIAGAILVKWKVRVIPEGKCALVHRWHKRARVLMPGIRLLKIGERIDAMVGNTTHHTTVEKEFVTNDGRKVKIKSLINFRVADPWTAFYEQQIDNRYGNRSQALQPIDRYSRNSYREENQSFLPELAEIAVSSRMQQTVGSFSLIELAVKSPRLLEAVNTETTLNGLSISWDSLDIEIHSHELAVALNVRLHSSDMQLALESARTEMAQDQSGHDGYLLPGARSLNAEKVTVSIR